MNFPFMRRIDLWVGLPLCVGLSLLKRCVRCVFRIGRRSRPQDIQEILVVKFLGIGTVVLCTPLIKSLKMNHPGAKVSLLTFAGPGALAEIFPEFDEVISLRAQNLLGFLHSILQALPKLWQNRYDLLINLEYFTCFPVLMSVLIPSRYKLAFEGRYPWRRFFFDEFVSYACKPHVADKFLEFAKICGRGSEDSTYSRPTITVRDHEKVEGLLAEAGVDPDTHYLVAVNVNRAQASPFSAWPEEYFVEAIDWLTGQPEVYVILIGSQEQEPEVQRYVARGAHPDRLCNWAGKLNFGELCALLKCCKVLVGNHSGPLHLAVCLDLPSVSFCGPESSAEWGPKGPRHTVLETHMHCSPCVNVYNHKDARCQYGTNLCLQRILPKEVIRVLDRELQTLRLSIGSE